MNTKELAALLHGREYREEITREMEKTAKANGLVVVFGASDDLMEFHGAIDDEYGAGRIDVDAKGVLPDFDYLMEDGDKNRLRDYFQREGKTKFVEAVWCAPNQPPWTYKTNIPHETFEIMEDDEIYCRGIVFSLADI